MKDSTEKYGRQQVAAAGGGHQLPLIRGLMAPLVQAAGFTFTTLEDTRAKREIQ